MGFLDWIFKGNEIDNIEKVFGRLMLEVKLKYSASPLKIKQFARALVNETLRLQAVNKTNPQILNLSEKIKRIANSIIGANSIRDVLGCATKGEGTIEDCIEKLKAY